MGITHWQRKTRKLTETRSSFEKAKTADPVSLDDSLSRATPLVTQIETNEEQLRAVFQGASDVVFRKLRLGDRVNVLIVYIDGLVNTNSLDLAFLEPILYHEVPHKSEIRAWLTGIIDERLVSISNVSTANTIEDVCNMMLNASVALLIDGDSRALILELKGYSHRAVSDPKNEQVLRGPREGFTEDLGVNTSMLRRKIRSTRLKFEKNVLGDVTNTNLTLSYVEGIAPDSLLDEVRSRITRIQIDGVLESGYVEEFIEDSPFSPFPTVQNTERPDVVAANLLEGKVAIFIDGSPFVLLVPFVLWGAFQSAEDYYERFLYASAVRMLRIFLMAVSLLLPSVYVALTTYHPQLIPTTLALTFAAAREDAPFPSVIETLMMEIAFEALREAGIRLPTTVGSAVSIVGALVIGEAAVNAGIVSAPIVIVVAVTGIASFSIPRYNVAIGFRLLRFPILFLAGSLGFFGITMGVLALLSHLVTLRSFGVPYLGPVPFVGTNGTNDLLWRSPRWRMHLRPHIFTKVKAIRTPHQQKPAPQRCGSRPHE